MALSFGFQPTNGDAMKRLILFALLTIAAAFSAQAENGIVDVQSAFGVEETADRVERILNEKGMTVFARIRHSEAAGKVGIELRDTELVIFGNPKVGSPLMRCEQTVAIDLPQKALIWEDEDAITWISYNDPRYLVQRHGMAGCDEVIAKIATALGGIARSAASD